MLQVASGYPTGSQRDKLDTCLDTSTFTTQDTQRETWVDVTLMVTKITAIKRHFNARCLQGNGIPSFPSHYCRLFGCNAAWSGISIMMTSLTLLSRFDHRHRDMRFLWDVRHEFALWQHSMPSGGCFLNHLAEHQSGYWVRSRKSTPFYHLRRRSWRQQFKHCSSCLFNRKGGFQSFCKHYSCRTLTFLSSSKLYIPRT